MVALVASAGGIKAIAAILSMLPRDLYAAVLVLLHISPDRPSHLVAIFSRYSNLPVYQANQGDPLRPATVYIAPPGHHLLLSSEGTLLLSDGPKVHYVKPSADSLFESLAQSAGRWMIGVVLTGGGSDGSGYITAIKQVGGMVIAQDEATSEIFGMPKAAVATGSVDLVLPLDQIAPCLVGLIQERTAGQPVVG